MPLDTRFGFNINELTTSSGASSVAQTKVQNIGREEVPDLMGLFKAGTALTGAIVEAKVKGDTQEGWVAGAEFVSSTNELSGTAKVEAYKNKMKELNGQSKAYAKGFQSNLGPGFIKALSQQEEERVNSELSTAFTAWRTLQDSKAVDPDIDITAEQYVKGYSEKYKVLPAKVRDAIYLGSTTKVTEDVLAADSQVELNEILKDWEEEKSENYNNNLFRNSRANKFKSLVNAADRGITNAITQKNKEFIARSKTNIDNAVNDDYLLPPTELDTDFNVAFSDPITNGNKKRQYAKEYKEATIRRDYISTYSPDGKHPIVPDEAKDAWQTEVTTSAMRYLVEGSNERFIDTILFNPEFSKDVGDSIYQTYVQAIDTKEMSPIMMKSVQLASTPRGATALRQSLGDDQYTEMSSVFALGKIIYNGNLVKARDYYNQQQMNPTKQPWDKDLQSKVFEEAINLGPMSNQYKNTMEILNNISPLVAKQQEPAIREYYENQQTSFRFREEGEIFGSKVLIDTSMADNFIEAESTDPEADRNKLTEIGMFRLGGDVNSMIMMPGGNVFYRDSLGGIGAVLNGSRIIELQNKKRLKAASEKEQKLPKGEVVTSTITNIGSGLLKSLMELGPAIARKHIKYGDDKKKVDPDMEVFDISDYSVEDLKETKSCFVIEGDTPSNNTLSPSYKSEYSAAKDSNLTIIRMLDEAIDFKISK